MEAPSYSTEACTEGVAPANPKGLVHKSVEAMLRNQKGLHWKGAPALWGRGKLFPVFAPS